MNTQCWNVLKVIAEETFISQRNLAEITGYSLGKVNKSMKELAYGGYIDEEFNITNITKLLIEENKPKNAIILAAGYGMRMVPINMELPKGLICVNQETLIERIIKQLHQVGIRKIEIVVGFMKEAYEYLIDKYDVTFIYNNKYSEFNNMYSLFLASNRLENTFIIPCDIWCAKNPFTNVQFYSWYMVIEKMMMESTCRVNRKLELRTTSLGEVGNQMIGIAYITRKDAKEIQRRLEQISKKTQYFHSFWEDILVSEGKFILAARMVSSQEYCEINTYEQLREMDEASITLKSDAITVIAKQLNVKKTDIRQIEILKKGMTNRSFLFSCNNLRYIMRIPGEGTEQLIDRKKEYDTYQAIQKYGISDDIVYICPYTGYKISLYLDNVRVCNPYDLSDIVLCMKRLRTFHEMELEVEHEFDLWSQIEYYERLWKETYSIYRDYQKTKENIYLLKQYIEDQPKKYTLTHIDAVSDNFLITEEDKHNGVRLIDWEYAAMQDPHIDIAMFAIYALYNKEQIDQLISVYFTEGFTSNIKTKIYCYIATCGLLWSNWCEYKRHCGVEFGEYSIQQYRYAKEFYRIAKEEIEKEV